ncbi:hypothetical protein OC842_001694 [Tilletia horrida]|uniref:ABC transporter domain-containing protein n=1 Tax=Tilletia horrida TaxID=155126 RepID=A0AAN6GHA7_9BASI|nr:hypothetical protein OC842_001694 [Tilletia horrida]
MASGLDLFASSCPPGLGGTNCSSTTCQSPYVDPAQRTLKPSSDKACPSCDPGFAGDNCNICSGQGSCQAARNRITGGSTPDITAAALGINQTLTCYDQPNVISQSFTDCEVNQPTLSALFPGDLRLNLIRVVEPDNSTLTRAATWPAQAGTTLSSVTLDGVVQFNCQAKGCSGANQTEGVTAGAKWGTYNWTCTSLQCYCLPNTKICSGGGAFDLAPIIASITGTLSLPCDYADPSNDTAAHSCAFKGAQLQNFLGEAGLPLQNCRSGACLAQQSVDQFWANSAAASGGGANGGDSQSAQLTGGVIAGLVVLGAVVAGLLALLGFGILSRRRAALKPRAQPSGPVGLRWSHLSYTLAAPNKVEAALAHATSTARRRRQAAAAMGSAHAKVDSTTMIVMEDLGHGSLQDDAYAAAPACLLQRVSGFAAPGKMVAILGVSGAGKTTLLDCLAGRAKSGTQGGQVSYLYPKEAGLDHQAIHTASSQSKLIAYVDQEDHLPALATVREALEFAATLSNTENVPAHERAQLVNRVLDTLGLTHVAHRRIGDSSRRGISGGEKRRVSIGLALVARPRVLLLDEPLSGLDSFSADRVIEALRRLANPQSATEGTTVLMTLHQPSSIIFHTFDDAILMGPGGRTLYHGPPGEALAWCERNGEPCPPGHNVADHLLAVSHRLRGRGPSATPSLAPHGAITAGGKAAPGSADSHADAAAEDENEAENERGERLEQVYTSVTRPRRRAAGTRAGEAEERTPTTFYTQLAAVSSRFWRHAWRDPTGPLAHLAVTLGVALIIGGCFFHVDLSISGLQNRVGSMFLSFIFLAFLCLSATTGLGAHRQLMIRERANGLYTPLAWLLSYVVYDLVSIRLICSVVLSIVVYWMVGLRDSARFFFEYVLVSALFTVDVALYNMCLAAGLEDLSTAVLAAGANILFQLGFAGFLLNLGSIPHVLRWLQWFVVMKYAMEAVGSNELAGLRIVDNLSGVPIDAPVSLVAPKLFGFKPFYYRDVLILALPFLLGFFAILTITVHGKMRELR